MTTDSHRMSHYAGAVLFLRIRSQDQSTRLIISALYELKQQKEAWEGFSSCAGIWWACSVLSWGWLMPAVRGGTESGSSSLSLSFCTGCLSLCLSLSLIPRVCLSMHVEPTKSRQYAFLEVGEAARGQSFCHWRIRHRFLLRRRLLTVHTTSLKADRFFARSTPKKNMAGL